MGSIVGSGNTWFNTELSSSLSQTCTSDMNPDYLWKLDELSGTAVIDAMGNQSGVYNNGVLLGQLSPHKDQGTSVCFENSDQNISIGLNTDNLLSVFGFSISMWAKLPTRDSTDLSLFDQYESGVGGVYLKIISGDILQLARLADLGLQSIQTTDYPKDTWFHIAVIVKSDELRLYINKVLKISSFPPPSVPLWATSVGLTLGGGITDGYLDNIAIWQSKIFTQANIDQLYNYGLGTCTPSGSVPLSDDLDYSGLLTSLGPVAYWRLGEPSGVVAVDEMGLYNGTYTGSPILGATSLIQGSSDTCVTFVPNDYMTVDTTLPTFTGEYTYTATIKVNANVLGCISVLNQTTGLRFYNYSGKLQLYAGTWRNTDFLLEVGVTYHLVLVMDTANTYVYVNGELVYTYVSDRRNCEFYRIGATSTGSDAFNGDVDEVAIFQGAFPSDTVTLMHYLMSPAIPASTDDYSAAVYALNPVAYWQLNDQSGDLAIDNMQGGHNGKYNGTPSYEKLPMFDTTRTSVTFKTGTISTNVRMGDDYSISFFLRHHVIDVNYDSYFAATISVGLRSVNGILEMGSGGGGFTPANTPLTTGPVYHIVVTKTGGFSKLYIDGVYIGVTTTSYTTPQLYHYIGGDSTAGEMLDGRMQDMAIFDYELSAVEITTLYGQAGVYTPPVPVITEPVVEPGFDPLVTGSNITLTNSDLTANRTANGWQTAFAACSILPYQKSYFEIVIDDISGGYWHIQGISVRDPLLFASNNIGAIAQGIGYDAENASVYSSGSAVGVGTSRNLAVNDILGMSIDYNLGRLIFYWNGNFQAAVDCQEDISNNRVYSDATFTTFVGNCGAKCGPFVNPAVPGYSPYYNLSGGTIKTINSTLTYLPVGYQGAGMIY